MGSGYDLMPMYLSPTRRRIKRMREDRRWRTGDWESLGYSSVELINMGLADEVIGRPEADEALCLDKIIRTSMDGAEIMAALKREKKICCL